MSNDELNTLLLNKVEALTNQLDKLTDTVKKNTDAVNIQAESAKELKGAMAEANKTFAQVSKVVNDLYAKVQQAEMLGKLWKQFGPAVLQSFGNKPKP